MALPLEQEIATYNAQLPTLIQSHGKFVLIKGDSIIDTFDTYSDAMKIGYERFGLDTFLVKQIMPPEQVLSITRSVIPCPPLVCH